MQLLLLRRRMHALLPALDRSRQPAAVFTRKHGTSVTLSADFQ